MTKEELRDSGERLFPIKELGSKEDVATLLDTYLDVVENSDPARFLPILDEPGIVTKRPPVIRSRAKRP